jgi:uncharacterized membrane protein (Fun14 family)
LRVQGVGLRVKGLGLKVKGWDLRKFLHVLLLVVGIVRKLHPD